jgi:hypothetical protein
MQVNGGAENGSRTCRPAPLGSGKPAINRQRIVGSGRLCSDPGVRLPSVMGRRSFVLGSIWPSAGTARFRADHDRSPRMTEVEKEHYR